jgi:hypothetical protein
MEQEIDVRQAIRPVSRTAMPDGPRRSKKSAGVLDWSRTTIPIPIRLRSGRSQEFLPA